MRRWQTELLLILALLVIPLLFFAPVIFGGHTLIPADNLYQYEPWASYRDEVNAPETPHNALLSDLVLQNYQWKAFIRQNIEDRELPLWQPNQFSGSPFLANGQHSMLYPFSILYYVLPLEAAFGWFTVSQLWLAGLMMYLYIRGTGHTRPAGMIAAVTVQLSSFFITATVHPMIQAGAAWLPFQLLMIEYVIRQQPFPRTGERPAILPWMIGGAIGLGMVHLAGHLEVTYYTLLVMAFYSAARLLVEWWQKRQWRPLLIPASMLIGIVVIGFGIGAVQFIPGVQAANDSFRTERDTTLDTVRGYALPNRHVAKFAFPNIYGNPAHHSYRNVFSGETITHDWLRPNPDSPDNPVRVTNTDFGIKNYVEGGAYVGLLPLILALIGIYAGLRYPRKVEAPLLLIFCVMVVLAVLFAFGTPFYAILYYGFPGVNQLHTPFRWLWILTVCIATLAAFGVDALRKPALNSFIQRLGIILIAGGLLLISGLIASRFLYDALEGPVIERLYTGLAGASQTFPDVRSFYSYQFWNVLVAGIVLTGSGVFFWLSQRSLKLRSIPLWGLFGVILIALDLYAATGSFNTIARDELLDYTPPPIEWLEQRMAESDQPFRIQTYNWESNTLNANSTWRYGLHDVRGYDSLFSKSYARMMEQITPQGQLDFNRIAPIPYYDREALAHPLLDILNVRYIITDWMIQDAEGIGYQRVYTDARDSVQIYENTDALPRAYTAPLPESGETYAPYEGCERHILGQPARINADHLRYIPPPSGACIQIEPATITIYDNSQVWVDARVDVDSWLVLADGYDDGWRAYIRPVGADEDAETEVDVYRVNDSLRGIKLEPGDWTIRFRYNPSAFQVGAFLSFISGMLVIFLTLLWLWNTFISESASTNEGRRLVKNSLTPIVLNLFNRGIDFAFAFIMLRILGPADAGIYYYAIVVFGWFDIVTNFGLNTLLTRDVSRHPESAGKYLFNTSLLRLGLATGAIPVLAGVLLFRNATVTPPLDATAVIAILLLYAGLLPNSISTGLTALFYAFEKAEYPAAIATITTLVKVTLGLGALLAGWGVIGLAGASILTNVVTFGILARLAYPLFKDTWNPVPDGQMQRAMMREAYPLMINHLLATVFFKSDVILMEAINGPAVVGIYSTAYKWLDALNIIPAFFTMALLPVMSRQALENRDKLKLNYVFSIKLLVITALLVATLTTFMARTLVGVLGGREFLPDGAIALQIMIWSIPIGWMNSLTQYVLIALDRQRQITGAFIIAVSFNIIGNLIFLPAYSFRAAAITTIFSEIVLFIMFFWLLRRELASINWLVLLWKPVIASTAAASVIWLWWSFSGISALIIGGLTYGFVLLMLRPFTPEENKRLARLVPGPARRLLLRSNG